MPGVPPLTRFKREVAVKQVGREDYILWSASNPQHRAVNDSGCFWFEGDGSILGGSAALQWCDHCQYVDDVDVCCQAIEETGKAVGRKGGSFGLHLEVLASLSVHDRVLSVTPTKVFMIATLVTAVCRKRLSAICLVSLNIFHLLVLSVRRDCSSWSL